VGRTHAEQPDSLRRRLKGDLDNIVLMAMRKEPDRRYQSAAQLSEDIRRYEDGLPVTALPNTFFYRAEKFVKRNRIAVAAAVLVLLSLVGGILATVRQGRAARREKDKAEAINTFLQSMLDASNPDTNVREHDRDLTVKDLLDEASNRLATEDLSAQPEVKAELQRIIGSSYLSLGQYDLAEQNLRPALEAESRMYGEDSVETLKTLVAMGKLWTNRGAYTEADKLYKRRLSILRAEQRRGAISADYVISALNDFALLRRAQGDSKEAETLLREALALAPQSSPESKNENGVIEAVLALTLADQGKFHEAEKIVRDKIAAIRQQTKDVTPELCANLTGLGSFLIEQAEFAEAEENLREAETIYRKLFNRSYMPLGDNLRLQAQAAYSTQQYTEAETQINEALEIYRTTSNQKYINYPTAILVQGLIYSRTGRTEEAEKLLRQAVQIRSENLPETHFLRAVANGVLGGFLTEQKRFAEAEPFLLTSYDSLKNSQSPNSPRIRTALQRLVKLYDDWGRPDAAKEYRTSLFS
jgi:tetratricopeptide (TPR) repeat protein